MATQKIQLTESQLREMTRDVILEAIKNGELDENFLSNVWGGLTNAAKSTGQAIAQRGNKIMADYNAGAAQSAKQDIEKQIEKSKAIIKQEQEKINALRDKYNQYAKKADSYTDKANKNAEKRGSNTRYNGYGLSQDNNTKDFYNQDDVNNLNAAHNDQLRKTQFSSRMRGAQQAHNKIRKGQQAANGENKKGMHMPNKPQAATNESINLRNIIREAINNVL